MGFGRGLGGLGGGGDIPVASLQYSSSIPGLKQFTAFGGERKTHMLHVHIYMHTTSGLEWAALVVFFSDFVFLSLGVLGAFLFTSVYICGASGFRWGIIYNANSL